MADGPEYKKHKSHKNGRQVDIRPLRKDGRHEAVYWYQVDDYDQAAMGKLIALFHAYPGVHKILYNDQHALTVFFGGVVLILPDNTVDISSDQLV